MLEYKLQIADLPAITVVKKTTARHITLRFSKDSKIKITAPFFIRKSVIEQFVRDNLDKIMILGEKHKKSSYTWEKIERLRREAKQILIPRTFEIGKRHNLIPNEVKIKNNSSNWGSCSVKRNINLNLKLMEKPPEVRDYVIIHELCHLSYMSHSQDFWQLVSEICTKETGEDYKKLRKMLKINI